MAPRRDGEPDAGYLFLGRLTRSVPADHSNLHPGLVPGPITGAACLRRDRRGVGPGNPPRGTRATLRATRDQGSAASGIVQGCRPSRIRWPVRNLASAGTAAPGCRAYRDGPARTTWSARRLEWDSIDE